MTQESYASLNDEDLQKAISRAGKKEFSCGRLILGSGIAMVLGIVTSAVGTIAALPTVGASCAAIAVGGLATCIAASNTIKKQVALRAALVDEMDKRFLARTRKNKQKATPKPASPTPQPEAALDFSAAVKKALDAPLPPATPMQLRRRARGPVKT